jgi:TP901 family phage tail tape measure protein
MGAGRVRQGQVYVEIGADPAKFFAALNKVNKRIAGLGRELSSVGAGLAGAGLSLAAPFVAGVAAATTFQNALLAVQASTGATAGQLDAVRAASMQMSAALSVGPAEAASAMLELLKAGMSLDAVLGGAGEAAIQFAKVGQMDVAAAAVVMSDAMNVFGVSSSVAANTISAAADASSTSIQQMAESFSMSAAVAALANQSIGDLSTALAILANNGVKGSDAGTSIKTMLMRLMAPADEAIGALDSLGLTVQSFRNKDGSIRPMVEIIGVLTRAMEGMDQSAKDDIFRRVFGQDAIRAAAILTRTGVDGFNAMQDGMGGALTVGEKYKTIMAGLAGAGAALSAAMQRLGIALGESVGGALMSIVPPALGALNAFTDLVQKNAAFVGSIGKAAAVAVVLGGALTGLGLTLRVVSFGLASIVKFAAALASPFVMVARLAAGIGLAFAGALAKMLAFAGGGIAAVVGFATQSGISMARASAGFGALAVNATISAAKISAAMTGQALAGVARFSAAGIAALAQYSAQSTAIMAVSAARAGAMGAAQVAATVSVISATVARAAEGNIRAAAIGVQALVRLGVAGTTNALIAGASFAQAAAAGSAGMLRLGVQGSTALASIGAGASRASAVTLTSLARAAAAGIAQAAALSAAWLAGMARMVASAAVSGVAMAASFLAPFAAIAAAIAGAGALAYAFKDQIAAAFASVGGLVANAASAIGTGFNQAVADGAVVFGDLYRTATTTFGGIYDALSAGDLAGAMDILWGGLVAGWLRGQEAIMGYIDPWISTLQNLFTDLGTNIAILWDQLWTALATNTIGATILGIFDNIAVGVMAVWDTLVAEIQKAWVRVQGFISGAKDTKERVAKIDNEKQARAEQRRQNMPGVNERVRRANEEADKIRADSAGRQGAMVDNASGIKAGREAENASRASGRRAATVAAEQSVEGKRENAGRKKAAREQAGALEQEIAQVSDMDALHELAAQFHALAASGHLNQEQLDKMRDSLGKAQERIEGQASDEAQASRDAAKAGADAAGKDVQQSKAEAVGTFSAFAADRMGFGSTLQERIAKAAEETATNTRGMQPALVGQ